MITPWFGPAPPWMNKYWDLAYSLSAHGYVWLLETNIEQFKQRVWKTLGIPDAPIVFGQAKVHDYRPVFGALYEEEIKDYDFWGFTDFDCVYGRVERWDTDEFLSDLDVHSDHDSYLCGPWSLLRSTPEVANLFREDPYWKDNLKNPVVTGWGEQSFSRILEQSGLRYKYTAWHGNDRVCPPEQVRMDGRSLLAGGIEIPMYHFRRTKRWPS